MKKLRKYLLIAKTSIQNDMTYSINIIFSSMFFAFAIFIFMQLWETVYGSTEGSAGYTVNKIVWYYIIAELIILSRSDVFNSLNRDVKNGNIVYLLNKPYNYVLYQFSNSMGQIGSKLVINVVLSVVIGLLYVGRLEEFQLSILPFIVFTVIMGILLNFFINSTIGLTAFWTEDNTAFYWIVQKLTFMLGVFLPVEFLPEWLQKVALSLPFSYIAYGPARLTVQFSYTFFIKILNMQVVYILFFATATYLMYLKGVKNLNVNGG